MQARLPAGLPLGPAAHCGWSLPRHRYAQGMRSTTLVSLPNCCQRLGRPTLGCNNLHRVGPASLRPTKMAEHILTRRQRAHEASHAHEARLAQPAGLELTSGSRRAEWRSRWQPSCAQTDPRVEHFVLDSHALTQKPAPSPPLACGLPLHALPDPQRTLPQFAELRLHAITPVSSKYAHD